MIHNIYWTCRLCYYSQRLLAIWKVFKHNIYHNTNQKKMILKIIRFILKYGMDYMHTVWNI